MRTNPTTRNRHSGRSGHADRKSYYKSSSALVVSASEAERVGSQAIESIQRGLVDLAGAQARRAAQITFSLIGRE